MFTKRSMFRMFSVLLVVLLMSSTASARPLEAPLGTGFTFQGKLTDGSTPANGLYDLEFKLFDALSGGAQVGGTVTLGDVTVTAGLFTVLLDFGNVFNGTALYLEIGVRLGASVGAYTALNPRQQLSATPYALYVVQSSNADLLDNQHASYYAIAGHNHWGQTWSGSGTGLTVSGGSTGVSGSGTSNGVYGYSSSNYGVYGDGSIGVRGSGTSVGVYGQVDSTTGTGVHGYASAASGTTYGIYGRSNSPAGFGVFGFAAAISGWANGVFGQTASTGGNGVYGYANAVSGLANGVVGKSESTSGTGVFGDATATSGTTYGVNGTASSTNGTGVMGLASATSGTTYGVYGQSNSSTPSSSGVYGYAATTIGTTYGVFGKSNSSSSGSSGVYGAGKTGVYGQGSDLGVYGSGYDYGVYGESDHYGVYGYATSSASYAGYFVGNVNILGALTKTSGSFKIDNPLNPAGQYLYHSFVESPDMKNIYDGVVALDAKGEAWVQMPEWFEALNGSSPMDYRYQLTCIGGYAPVYIAQEMQGNRFKIAGGTTGLRVSWQVTGIRHDPYAEANRIPVVVDKPANEQGTYLYPELYGQPESAGLDYQKNPDQNAELH